MKRLAIVAAMVAIGVAVPLSLRLEPPGGAAHLDDPTADDTDVYAYTAKDAPDSLTVAANWIPFEDPAGGPNFYRFDDHARYYINIDNTGDGRLRRPIPVQFKDHGQERELVPVRASGRQLDRRPEAERLPDVRRRPPGLQQGGKRHADGSRKGRKHRRRSTTGAATAEPLPQRARSQEIIHDAFVAPNNVGPEDDPGLQHGREPGDHGRPGRRRRCSPASATTRSSSISGRPSTRSTSAQAGPGDQGGGKDDLAGYAVHSIVLQVPRRTVTKNGKRCRLAERQRTPSSACGPRPSAGASRSSDERRASDHGEAATTGSRSRDWATRSSTRSSSRSARRTCSTAPPRPTTPRNYGKYVVKPELAAVMNALFPGVVNAPETDRTDIVQAVLQGLPGLNQQSDNADSRSTRSRSTSATPPAANPNRLGVLGRRHAGLPERPPSDRRRRRHRRSRVVGRVSCAATAASNSSAGRRSGPERQAVPGPVPVPRATDLGVRLEDQGVEPTGDPVGK